MTTSVCHTPGPTQREQLEHVLVSGAAIALAQDPSKAKSLAEGIKQFLDTLHPQPVLYNPQTGAARDPRDVASDPQAILCRKPGEPLKAYKPLHDACESRVKGETAKVQLGQALQVQSTMEEAKKSIDQYAEKLAAGAMPAINLSASAQADQAAEAEIVAAGLTAPRVTADQIQSLMDRVVYHYEQPQGTTSTFAHAFLDGFYLASGYSACVSAANFDAAKGQKYTKEQAEPKARDKLWELEGYALHSKLTTAAAQ